MTALSYSTVRENGGTDLIKLPIAAEKVLAGSLACRNTAGYMCKGTNSAGYMMAGYFTEEKDNSAGSAGDLSAHIACGGKIKVATSGASQASIGLPVWLTDDNTVQFTPTHVYAGVCVDYESATSIWIEPPFFKALGPNEWVAEATLALTTVNATVTLMPAWFNAGPNGVYIKEFYGIIQTVPAGGDQDQPTVDIYDSSDSDLSCQIAFADGSGDAIGDVRFGTGGFLSALSAGNAVKKCATTGRSIYAKVTTAAAGAGAAGSIRVVLKVARY